MGPDILLLILAAAGLGTLVGTFTGLVPGIHVNTAASVMVALHPAAVSFLGDEFGGLDSAVLISCCIMAAATVHSFVDFVPSVFIGAPDPDEALSVLPGHLLVSQGKGMVAVRAAAIGSAVGAACAVALAVPLQWIMLHGGEDLIDPMTLGVLLVALGTVVLTSPGKIRTAAMLLLSGAVGCAVMDMGIPSHGLFGEGTLLFPMLAGLFGIPPLLEKSTQGLLPPQTDDVKDPVGILPGIRGVATGLVAGWFPGITATTGATITAAFSEEKDPASFISLTGSIGTVTAIFSVVTLSVSGKGRSGTAISVGEMLGDGLQGFCSEPFVLILLSIALASAAGYAVTVRAGKMMIGIVDRIPAETLGNAVLVLVAALVFVFTGPWGLAVLSVCSGIGMIPPNLGIGRVCLVGCIIIPCVLNLV
ncbi:putative membrane protein [Thermoplasmatales archaeon BRNA1]|nr:putative membrane protein [Thermoplasmatales archaeon BRNA1]